MIKICYRNWSQKQCMIKICYRNWSKKQCILYLTLFLKIIRRLLPFVASAFVADINLCFEGFILELFLSMGPCPLLLDFTIEILPFWLPLDWFPLSFCFVKHALQIGSPLSDLLHSVDTLHSQEIQIGFAPSGILNKNF